MRISHIGARVCPVDESGGGIEGHVQAISSGLAQRGHEVTVYTRQRSYRKDVSLSGLKVRYRPGMPGKGLEPAFSALLATCEAAIPRADVVHFHGEGAALFAGLPRRAGRKVITTIHGLDWKRDKWGAIGRTVMRMGERMAARNSDEIICVSRDLSDYWERRYGRRPVYLPNAPLDATGPRDDSILSRHSLRRRRYLLFLGRLVPEKRIDHLIAAFSELVRSDRSRFCGLKLVVGGVADHTESYASRLRRMAQSAPVVFTGGIGARERNALFGSAALFVLPSALEGMPLSLLEAMAAGVPSVASDIAVHRELIEDGRTGWLFSVDQPDRLCRVLRTALGDPRIREIGHRASDSVRSRFRWPEIVAGLERVYLRIVADGPG